MLMNVEMVLLSRSRQPPLHFYCITNESSQVYLILRPARRRYLIMRKKITMPGLRYSVSYVLSATQAQLLHNMRLL